MSADPESKSSTKEDYDVEEAGDTIATSLRDVHERMFSDVTGMTAPRRNGRRTVSDLSDMVLNKNLPPPHTRRRQKSSSDVISKFNQASQLGFDDLRMAEGVLELGGRRERMESGLSDIEFIEKIEEKDEYGTYDTVFSTVCTMRAYLHKSNFPCFVASTLSQNNSSSTKKA